MTTMHCRRKRMDFDLLTWYSDPNLSRILRQSKQDREQGRRTATQSILFQNWFGRRRKNKNIRNKRSKERQFRHA